MHEAGNILEIANMRPDFMGFIFHDSSPRDISYIADTLPLKQIPKSINKVLVVVNKPLEHVLQLVDKYDFDLVQLHGAESPDYCMLMSEKVSVIKVFPVWDALPADLKHYDGVCDYFLFDSKGDKAGGNGIAFPHEILKTYPLGKPFFLSGGLTPEHAHLIPHMQLPHLYGVDINSRFEAQPGLKDTELVKCFKDKLDNPYAQHSEQ